MLKKKIQRQNKQTNQNEIMSTDFQTENKISTDETSPSRKI